MLIYSDTFGSFIGAIYHRLTGIPWGSVLATTHDLFLLLDIVLIAGIAFVVIDLLPYRPRFYSNPRRALPEDERKKPTLKDEQLAKKWQTLQKKAESAPPQSLTLGIIEADSFVDDILKRMGLEGDHMADRLEQIDTGDIKTLDRLWKAHRARNDLVHTPGYTLSAGDSRRLLADYEAFLKEMDVI